MVKLSKPPPKPDEDVFCLMECIIRDYLLAVCKRKVVCDEIIEVDGDAVTVCGGIGFLYFLQLVEIVGQLFHYCVPVCLSF